MPWSQEHAELKSIFVTGFSALVEALLRIGEHSIQVQDAELAIATLEKAQKALHFTRSNPLLHAKAALLLGRAHRMAAQYMEKGGNITRQQPPTTITHQGNKGARKWPG